MRTETVSLVRDMGCVLELVGMVMVTMAVSLAVPMLVALVL